MARSCTTIVAAVALLLIAPEHPGVGSLPRPRLEEDDSGTLSVGQGAQGASTGEELGGSIDNRCKTLILEHNVGPVAAADEALYGRIPSVVQKGLSTRCHRNGGNGGSDGRATAALVCRSDQISHHVPALDSCSVAIAKEEDIEVAGRCCCC